MLPGTFDPVTLGHVDVARRAATLFDEVVVAIAVNPGKTPLLDAGERRSLFASAVVDEPRIRVDIATGLLVDFARSVGAAAIVKGLRGGADFDAEAPMALMNRHLADIETVFVIGDQRFAHISSSLVRDIARHHGRIDDLVPAGVASLVRARLE